ncbi:Uncharacterised protein [Sphingobacterium daejeonense]|nr:Uncharacterised protein [Sphingobacterium daejeonense]
MDAAASEAFAVSDHQIAHIYTKSEATKQKVKSLLADVAGIDKVLDKEEKAAYGIDHESVWRPSFYWRKGMLGLTYYFWEDDAKAPDYARMVDIHKKPGYDPVEMFMTSKSRAIYKLILKKIGIRAVLDITPLDPSLVKGSHGITDVDQDYYPILIGNFEQLENIVEPTAIKNLLLNKIFVNKPVDEIVNS